MTNEQTSRRQILRTAFVTLGAGAANMTLPSFVFPDEQDNEQHVPFLDMPETRPYRLNWEALDHWITPQQQIFNVQHYGVPEVDSGQFQLEIGGLVDNPQSISLDALKRLPKKEQLMTLECSGSGVSKGFMDAIYNGKWTGTPLVPILEKCGVGSSATEVVFFGTDRKKETLREGTDRELTIEVPFGRSMSLEDAMTQNVLLAYQFNDAPIEHRNGAPLRLIVPGWYGIANVKWLQRIELRDRRYMGRYMGRDYVTVRGERHGDEIVFIETSVTRMNLKSIVARVTRKPAKKGRVPLKAYGAVWSDGTEIKGVEVKMDGHPWREARLDLQPHDPFSWIFFSIDLGEVAAGKHTVVSRAIDVNGRVQPTTEDDEIALKKTYWEAYQQWPREIEINT